VQKVRTHYHIFPGFIDPYIEPGNPRSGILPGVHGEDPGKDFEGDHRIQAYCFRMCLTDVKENMVPIEKPEGYDELEYELLFRNFESGEDRIPWLPHMMPNRKTDTNNRWGFSTNKIGINYEYPNGNYNVRESIIAEQEHYQKGIDVDAGPITPGFLKTLGRSKKMGPCPKMSLPTMVTGPIRSMCVKPGE
jgi:hypothetical protein